MRPGHNKPALIDWDSADSCLNSSDDDDADGKDVQPNSVEMLDPAAAAVNFIQLSGVDKRTTHEICKGNLVSLNRSLAHPDLYHWKTGTDLAPDTAANSFSGN